jgi:chitinase
VSPADTGWVRLRVALLVFLAVACVGGSAQDAVAARDVYAGYFGGWNVAAKGYYPKDIRARRLTHVYYAFAVPGADGTCAPTSPWADYQRPFAARESVDGVPDAPAQALRGNFNQLRKLKRANRGLKVLIAIGGWGGSTYFSDVAATRAARNRFAASCVDRFIRGNLPGAPRGAGAGVFNGLDIDWEYPGGGAPGNHTRPGDRANATRLFRTLRRHLDRESARTGRRYLLTAALPVGTSRYELSRVASVLDWANLMTYDLHGPWESETNFNAPFAGEPGSSLSVKGAVAGYLAAGVPRAKIVVGVPFYARQYVRVGRLDYGLHRPFDNRGLAGDAASWARRTTPTYHDLVDVAGIVTDSRRDPRARKGFTRRWSTAARVPWLYRPRGDYRFGRVSRFLSYDDPSSIARKSRYARRQGLRGVMAWELSQDSDARTLVRALSPRPVR